MHFFPTRRLYQCSDCDRRTFANKREMEARKWAATTGAFMATAVKSNTPAQSR
jgi:hypothetical protein